MLIATLRYSLLQDNFPSGVLVADAIPAGAFMTNGALFYLNPLDGGLPR